MRTPFERCNQAFFTAALVGLGLQSVLAATLSVPGDYATIQEAIDASVAGDTVVVADGFVCDSGSQAVTGRDAKNAVISAGNARLVITKGITLTSASGTTNNPVLVVGRTHSDPATATIVTNIGPDAVRCLYVKTAAGERAVIRGFAFTGGNTCGTTRSADGKSDATSYVARGGGVWCDNCATAPLIENCLLTNNFSYYFGGALSGPAVASNCLFRANRITFAASGNGGAAAYGSDICTSLICNNTSAAAAGAVRGGSCTDCVIRDNSTPQNQTSGILGGIVWGARLERCLVKGNTSSGAKTSCTVYGGTLIDCDLQGNSGGTAAHSYCNGTAYNCRFYGPASGGKPHIFNSTLYGCVVSNLHLYASANMSGGVVNDCTAYNCLFYDLLTNKSTNQNQYEYGAQLVNSKLFNCTMVILKSAYPVATKKVSYNAVYGCQLVNTVLVTPAGFGTTLANFSSEACGTIVATNACLPAIYRDGGKLADSCHNIFVGEGEPHSSSGVWLEGDKIFQLTPRSPCRNAGWDGSSSTSDAFPYLKRSDDNPAYGFDFAGNRRVSGGAVDIGAFESRLLGLRLSVQ
jgi:hypothetical protein